VTPVGVRVTPVTVAAQAELTLPEVVVPVAPLPKLGQPLPALDLKDPAGKPIDLAAFKGRYVLLHGWAGWCAACARDYPALRKLRADVPAEKLALVGLNLDADPATASKRAAKYAFPWPHACLGGPGGSSSAERLRVGAIPLYVVLAPDGGLAFRGANWAEAERFLRGKLGK
jgi:thiol-disulfide isomerase/thioredoxin